MRNFEILIGVKSDNPARKKIETFLLAELFALGK